MRILLIILALLNVGYFFYIHSSLGHSSQNNKAGTPQPVPGIKSLDVIPERELNAYRVPEKGKISPEAFKRSTVQRPLVRKPHVQQSSDQKQPVEKTTVQKPTVQKPAQEILPKVKVLSIKPTAIKVSLEDKKIKSCYTFGPVRSDKAAKHIITFLQGKISNASIRNSTKKTVSGYWVYLDSYKSFGEAKKIALQLRKDKVKQNFIVLSGQYKNAISLGLFKDQVDANRRLIKIRRLGFKPLLADKYSNQPVYWVDYEVTKGNGVSTATALSKEKLVGNPKNMMRVCPVGTS